MGESGEWTQSPGGDTGRVGLWLWRGKVSRAGVISWSAAPSSHTHNKISVAIKIEYSWFQGDSNFSVLEVLTLYHSFRHISPCQYFDANNFLSRLKYKKVPTACDAVLSGFRKISNI